MTFLLIGAIVVPLIGVPVVYWFSLLLKYRAGFVASLLSIVPLAAVLIAGGQGPSSPQGSYSELYAWSPIGTFGLRADKLTLPSLLIISWLVTLMALFSVTYMRYTSGNRSAC